MLQGSRAGYFFIALSLLVLGVAACGPASATPETATAWPTATAVTPGQVTGQPSPATPSSQPVTKPLGETPTPTQPTPAPPTSSATPAAVPPAVSSGPFVMVAAVPPELIGEIRALDSTSGGDLWLITSNGTMMLREGHWQLQPWEGAEILVGVDDARRMWLFLERNGSRIYTWDGRAEPTPADDGWIPVPNPIRLQGQGVLTDATDRVWLATDQDVRMFDGTRWTAFSPEDMGMISPAYEDVQRDFTLEAAPDAGLIWVGACDWGGPGPMGGGGARWFDGKAWQGADSPVVSGCITAIQGDGRGGVWAGVDSDLWHYDPAAEAWERFAPPEPPEGYRFGYIADLALDPQGEPWPLFAICGGASCDVAQARFRLQAGKWIPVGEIRSEAQTLVFDKGGNPWLVLGRQVVRVEDDQMVDPPAATLIVDAVTVDALANVWVAAAQPGGPVGLWVLEGEPHAADGPAVCPLPGEDQPPQPSVVEGQTIVEIFEPQILAYLDAGGDAPGLQAALGGLVLADSSGEDWQSRVRAFAIDLTGDLTPEIVVDLVFFVEGQFADGALFVYHCQAGKYVGGAIERIGGHVSAADVPDPGIRSIQDMNRNGLPEIVFSYILAMGTHANFSRLFRIVEWDGDQFVDLIRSSGPDPHVAEVQNGDGEVLDSDGDGFLELVLANGVGRGPAASALERPRTDVWSWDGEAFALDHSRSASPPLFRIQAIWDGDSATRRGDYDAALAFYQQAISDPQLLGWSQDRMASDAVYEGGATPTPDPDEHLRLSAYGWYRIMLLHVAGKRLAEAQSAYDTLQGQHPEGSAGRAYAALATVFWEEFNRSQDVAAACDRAAEYATDHGDRVLAPLGSRVYGLGQRDYAAEEICPSQLLPTVAPTIVTFRVELEDVAAGKQLTFEWETIGATRAEIWSGATPRRPKMWKVPPTGALTVVQAETYMREPSVVLIAYDDQNQRASRTIRTEWSCAHTYFFEPAPDACPLHEAIDTAAAGQAFEHGRMIWLERIHGGERVILVLYDDGHLARLDDTWTPAEPESDPTLVPPDGLLQPVRGFGKAWRENAAVRERLGWALAPEHGFESHWQEQLRESIPRMAFVQTLDGKTVKLHGWELGTPSWQSSWTDFPEP